MVMSKLHMVRPPAHEAAFLGEEPVWDTVEVTSKNYNNQILRGLNWHNYCASEKDHVKYLEEWARRYRQAKDLEAIRKANKPMPTICNIARMHLQGFPLSKKHVDQIHDYLDKEICVLMQKVKAAPATMVKVVSVQDRIKQQVSGTLADLAAHMNSAFDGDLPEATTLIADIMTKGYKAPQLKLVSDFLKKNLTEWAQAYNKQDEQLVEGYSYMPRRKFKQLIDVFTEIFDNISSHQTKIKTQRIVRKKPVDKRKLASKMKFMKEHTELGLKSLDPVNIIGANMVWVFDTKTRRIGVYEGELQDSLFIRGTMIDGFKFTCSKILRKPNEQIAQFMKLRKNQTRKWLDDIKAKCGTLRGRSSNNLILLRID